MAIVLGNESYLNPTPGTSYTYSSHSQNTGANGYLVVLVAARDYSAITVSGITWNGVSMVQRQQGSVSSSGAETIVGMYTLASPATGTNDLVVNFSGNQQFGISVRILSFTGVDSANGNSQLNAAATSIVTETMTVSANSRVVGIALSRFSLLDIELPQGSSVSNRHDLAVYLAQVGSGVSAALSAGSTNFDAECTGTNPVSLSLLELLEASAPPPTRRRITCC